MSKSSHLNRTASPWQSILASAMLWGLVVVPQAVIAGEGGTTHVIPGSMATIVDNLPTAPGTFMKPMYLHYSGSASAQIPTAAGLASNLDANANTVVLSGGYTFETTVLGGAHYSVVAALPYTWLDITASVQTPLGTVRRNSRVDGFGDLTVVPAMLAWKSGDWQFNALLPIYAPTGSYQQGRLGNPGLNYWTFDPIVGVVYSDALQKLCRLPGDGAFLITYRKGVAAMVIASGWVETQWDVPTIPAQATAGRRHRHTSGQRPLHERRLFFYPLRVADQPLTQHSSPSAQQLEAP